MANTTFVDGETLIEASWLNDVNTAVYNPAAAIIPASSIVNTPAGNIAATNVQAAINELDTEKQPLDADLTAIAALTTDAYGRSLLTTTSEANFKSTVNLEAGVDVQAYSANIPTVAPGTAGNVITSDGTSWTSTAKITNMTAQASTSGSTINFTGIPSSVKRVTIMFAGISSTGTSQILVRIGSSGGIETTGYVGSAGAIQTGVAVINLSGGFYIGNGTASTYVLSGSIILSLLNSSTNTWTVQGIAAQSDVARITMVGGYKSLSLPLDRLSITTSGGTDTFDAGSINILYE